MTELLLSEGAALGLLLGLLIVAPSPDSLRLHARMQDISRVSSLPLEGSEAAFQERIIQPLREAISNRLGSILPKRQVEALKERLERAGNPTTPGLLMGARIGLMVVSLVPLFLGLRGVLFAIALMVLGWRLPEFWLARRIASRQKQFQRGLADVMDLLSVSVEAGLGFDGALARVAENFPPPISVEFGRALREIRLGRARADALHSLEQRMAVPELTTFVSAVIQADELGVGLARVLKVQSEQMRTLRRQRAQEQALKTPIKMLFPLIFFIFPAIFVVLLGPAALSFATVFSHP